MDLKAREIAELLHRSEKTVIFTGAGISTESGIPDFRSPGGVWARYQPVYYDEFMSSRSARERYWEMKKEFYLEMKNAKPNAAHLAVAEIHNMGKLEALITQNIDGLHQDAGVPDHEIIELHGTNRWVECQHCHRRITAEEAAELLEAGEKAPDCECGGYLKPATISFGQAMPEEEMRMAIDYSSHCDLFIVIGSSLQVYPAASMPELAVSSGANLVIINRDPTPHDHLAKIVCNGTAGEVMQAVVSELKKLQG